MTYNCASVQSLPYKGAELLFIACIFLFIAVCFAVSFLEVTAKQLWSSYLDPAVAARLAEIQRMFPNLGCKLENEEQAHTVPHPETNNPIPYDGVLCAAPYISSKSVDEDVLYVLANNTAFPTVSSYCSSTVRGYAMLSVMLVATSATLSFLWCHNAVVDPVFGTSGLAQASLLGYILTTLTGIVMMTPEPTAVGRNANQLMWFSVPLTQSSWINNTHMFGLGCGLLLPLYAHMDTVLKAGPALFPNYYSVLLSGAALIICMVVYGVLQKGLVGGLSPYLTELQSAKLSILVETCMVFTAFLGDLQYEIYAAASCVAPGGEKWFSGLIVFAMFAPFALMSLRAPNAPRNLDDVAPALLLTYKGVPQATYGTCPVVQYNNVKGSGPLPHLKMEEGDVKTLLC